MKVKFANGVTKECAAPIEQKLFRTINGEHIATTWVLMLNLTGEMTSTELDSILTNENVNSLEFLTTTEEGEDATIFTLSGYEKVTSSTIRHAEDTNETHTEIQLSRGV